MIERIHYSGPECERQAVIGCIPVGYWDKGRSVPGSVEVHTLDRQAAVAFTHIVTHGMRRGQLVVTPHYDGYTVELA